MKKIVSLFIILCMLICLVPAAFAADNVQDKTLSFNSDGKFKIVVINDFQDTQDTSEKSLKMLRKVLDTEKPDLVVLNGDQLCDSFPKRSFRNFRTAIGNLVSEIDARKIPFIYTYGNHDNDKTATASLARQATIYHAYDYCFAAVDGYDSGTYNKLVMSSDGTYPALNIYMMNTGDWDYQGSKGGVTDEQVEWYKSKSDGLRAANGGNAVPSMLFQHIPVKETWKLLREVPEGTDGAVKCHFEGLEKWYVLDESKVFPSAYNSFRESICSEHPSRSTGQYEAWCEKGDIIGAFFAHDHMNNFLGKTDEGIVMGYNRGFGYGSYGDGDKRGCGVLVFDENDIENYEFYNVTYEELFAGEPYVPDEPDTPEDEGGFLGFVSHIRSAIADFFYSIFDRITGLFGC